MDSSYLVRSDLMWACLFLSFKNSPFFPACGEKGKDSSGGVKHLSKKSSTARRIRETMMHDSILVTARQSFAAVVDKNNYYRWL